MAARKRMGPVLLVAGGPCVCPCAAGQGGRGHVESCASLSHVGFMAALESTSVNSGGGTK